MFENKLFCDFSCLFQLFNVSLHHKLIIKSQRYGKWTENDLGYRQ